jgi:hypothetical protein
MFPPTGHFRLPSRNGNLLVGMAYTAMLDLKPGDEFEIKLSEKKGVTLIPVGAEDEE